MQSDNDIKIVEIIREVAKRTSARYLEKYPGRNPVHFFADNYLMVGYELTKLGKSAKGQKVRYPAILLFCDNMMEREAEPILQWKVEATLHILIVTDAFDGNGDMKREKNFYPTLYPIHRLFFDEIENHPQIFTSGEYKPRREKFDRLNLIAMLGKNSVFSDKLDGIEIRNLRLRFREKNCLTSKNNEND